MDQGERVTVKELAEQLGISKTAVQKRADALGIVFAKEGKRGTRTATHEQAEAIREAIRGTDLGADQDEQINIFEIIGDPEPSEAEPKKSPKKPKAEQRRTKDEQKEPDATGAAVEVLRELLKDATERAAQDRAQAEAEQAKLWEQIRAKDEQIRAKDEQLKANDEKIKGLMIMLREEQARTDALLPAPGAADPEGAADQEPEQPAQAPAPEQPKGTIWERIKAYFRG